MTATDLEIAAGHHGRAARTVGQPQPHPRRTPDSLGSRPQLCCATSKAVTGLIILALFAPARAARPVLARRTRR